MNKIFEDMDKDLTEFLNAVLPLSKRQPKVFEKKSAITKEKRLLVYILNVQTSGERFKLSKYADDIIAYGITKNRNSLNVMLNTLRNKQLIQTFFPGCWRLTQSGLDEAEFWFKKLEDDAEMNITPSTSQKQEVDSRDEEIENLKRELLSLYKQNVVLKSKVNHMLSTTISQLADIQDSLKAEARITR